VVQNGSLQEVSSGSHGQPRINVRGIDGAEHDVPTASYNHTKDLVAIGRTAVSGKIAMPNSCLGMNRTALRN
jgi:hypothetical protein